MGNICNSKFFASVFHCNQFARSIPTYEGISRMKIVLIEWLDSNISQGWHGSSEQDYGPLKCQTVGFLVGEGEDYVALSGSTSESDASDACDVMTIPKIAITKRTAINST